MTYKDASKILIDFKLLISVYERLYNDPKKGLYGDECLKHLIKMANNEIRRLEEMIYNQELEDEVIIRGEGC